MSRPPKPVKHPGDRDTPLTITCAWCGASISFHKHEVYVNGPSYVCRDHAYRDCRTCKYAAQNPAAGNLLCQHPSLPCMQIPFDQRVDPPGVCAAQVSGRLWTGSADEPPCLGYKLWEIHPKYLKKEYRGDNQT